MRHSWKTYCKTNGIRFEYETATDVRFVAPKGKTFGNDCNFRFVEDIDEMSRHELEDILVYT